MLYPYPGYCRTGIQNSQNFRVLWRGCAELDSQHSESNITTKDYYFAVIFPKSTVTDSSVHRQTSMDFRPRQFAEAIENS